MRTPSEQHPETARPRRPLWAGALILLVAAFGCDKPTHPVAQVGRAWVGQPEWTYYLEHHPAATPAVALEDLLRREVAWQQAERRGLLEGENWEAFKVQNRVAVLSRAYLDRQPGAPPLTEAAAKAHFMASNEQRRVVHLVCKTESEAKAALGRIQKGEGFEKVATALSIDPSTASNHGNLGWIKRDQVVQAFADPVFGAKVGELRGPFQSEFGWHVAQVREVKAPTDADFEQNKAALLAGLEEMNQTQRRPAVLAPLRATYPLKADRAVLSIDRTTVPVEGDEKRVAGKVGSKEITLKALKLFMGEAMNVGGASHGLGPETKGKFLDLMADDLRLTLAAEKAGLPKEPGIKAAIWDSERAAAFNLFSQIFLKDYKPQEAELSAHYQAHLEHFRSIGAVKVYLLVADLPETVDQAAREAQKGVPWKQLVDKYAIKESTGQWDAGWLEVSGLQKVLPKEAVVAMLKQPLGSLVGPVPSPEGSMLFKVLERRPGEVLPFKDCLEQVQKDFVKVEGAAVVKRYLDGEGKAGLSVKTFPENLNSPVVR
ncbi:peptidyl-prolyl cis-trans isomerase [Geothrix edaphica]|uniref:PpiC domain-containing protein n=1 Tax=Geothrix edaphica TaxID=2927976 RepID=A0ABQ5PZK1_9BACT|nr:peptidyl-prolyl cis-trans isomerase [Geothrix edaphica]GLH67808.1 hypothetical protein GETHED_21720 [Geothrix edaphica]